MIDITKPLELSDGTPCRYVGESNVAGAKYHVVVEGGFRDGWHRHFKADGSHVWDELPSLRNVKETKMERTGLEHVERLERLARRIAAFDAMSRSGATTLVTEAREIVAELDKQSVGIDLIEARKLAATRGDDMDARIIAGDMDTFECVIYRLEGIAKGRELERAELKALGKLLT